MTGKTIAEATSALEKHLTKYFDAARGGRQRQAIQQQGVLCDYEGLGEGGTFAAFRLPVRDGAGRPDRGQRSVAGLQQEDRISRPSASNPEKGTVLPVDYAAITRRGATATNYQILPGDRIFIAEDPLLARTNEFSSDGAARESPGPDRAGNLGPWRISSRSTRGNGAGAMATLAWPCSGFRGRHAHGRRGHLTQCIH